MTNGNAAYGRKVNGGHLLQRDSPGWSPPYVPQPLLDKLQSIPFAAEAVQCKMDRHKWVVRLA